MRPARPFDLPPEKERDLRAARRLEKWTLIYVSTSAAFLGVTMAGSQAMRTSFYEDLISAVPAIMFLVCTRIARRAPNERFPYGYHGAVSIGYLTASLALVVMGGFLLIEAAIKLATVERTTIGGMTLFGQTVWAGWPMLAAVTYTAVPSVFLGRAKMKLAPRLHDKILYADARMMKADWMAETATAIGVLGAGFGFWWVDPLAAAVVSADIIKDGAENVGVAVADLIERQPMKTDRSGPEPVIDELRSRMEGLDWVEHADVRLREVGHVFFGEVFVTPRSVGADLPGRIRQALDEAHSLNWRLHDVTITVLEPLPKDSAKRPAAS
jgi:cation diffusion facilitator family transporter